MNKHQLETTPEGFRCAVCGWIWKREPQSDCPGVKRYSWGAWGENLLTKKQMNDAGYQTGKKLPAPSGCCQRDDSPGGWMWLYDKAQGVPKRVMSEAQKAAITKAAEVAQIGWTCKRCGYRLRWYVAGGGLCNDCSTLEMIEEDHKNSAEWAKGILQDGNWIILDTETTGLTPGYNEVVQLAVVSITGETLLNTLIKPQYPERMHEKTGYRSAFDIHGIAETDFENAPTFPEIYPQLKAIIEGKQGLIYNLAFDAPMIQALCIQHQLERLNFANWECAMEMYAAWYGEWSTYHRSYRWQPLNGGHTALDDCLEVIKVIKTMARGYEDDSSD